MKILLGTVLIALAASQVIRNNLAPAYGTPYSAAPVHTVPQWSAPVYAAQPAPVFAQAPIAAPGWGGFGNCWSNQWEYQ